jgi:hypothetical protein
MAIYRLRVTVELFDDNYSSIIEIDSSQKQELSKTEILALAPTMAVNVLETFADKAEVLL